MRSNLNKRLDQLEQDTQTEPRKPTYISVSVDEWESGDLEVDRPVKVYIGISPDDWDIDDEP